MIVHPKKPCSECPWRRDVEPGRFPPERFRLLAASAYDVAITIFACHKSADKHPTACAGFLLRGATHNLSIRLARSCGNIGEVSDGGYELFQNYREMAIANGVRANDPALTLCRGD